MADNKQQVFEILMNNLQTNFLNVKFVLDFMKNHKRSISCLVIQ